MFSVMGDTVLDPYLGTGTTLFAAACAGRNGVGYELDDAFQALHARGWGRVVDHSRRRIGTRFDDHLSFIRDRQTANKTIKHTNRIYGFPVVTRQETELMIPLPATIKETAQGRYRVSYEIPEVSDSGQPASLPQIPQPGPSGQLKLFNAATNL